MTARIKFQDLVWATDWIDDDGNPTGSFPDSSRRVSLTTLLEKHRAGEWIIEGYRHASAELETLPVAWADLPVSWDILNDTARWNGIAYGFLTVRGAGDRVGQGKGVTENS